jgi:hypothetical protein
LGKEALIYVRDDSLDTAQKMWDSLERQFAGKSVQNKVNISEKLYSMKMSEGSSPVEHIAEMTKLIQQYRSCGESFDDAAAARRLIGSLPESFNAIKAALLVRVDTLTWAQAVESVREFWDMQSKCDTNGESTKALRARDNKKGKNTRGSGKGYGGPTCWSCGDIGHLKRDCPKKTKSSGRGSSWKGGRSQAGTASHALSAGGRASGWIVDSGASDHMTNDRGGLRAYVPYRTPGTVYLGDDSTVPSHGEGSISITVANNGSRRDLNL